MTPSCKQNNQTLKQKAEFKICKYETTLSTSCQSYQAILKKYFLSGTIVNDWVKRRHIVVQEVSIVFIESLSVKNICTIGGEKYKSYLFFFVWCGGENVSR